MGEQKGPPPLSLAGARVIALSYPGDRDFRPQPEGGEGLCLERRRHGLAAKRDGWILAHGVAIGRLVDVKYTAASAV
jgi:hypothetical protein